MIYETIEDWIHRNRGLNGARFTFAGIGAGVATGATALATSAAAAAPAITAGAALAGAGISAAQAAGAFGGGSGGGGGAGGAGSFPTYNGEFQPIPGVNYDPSQVGSDLMSVYPALQKAAGQATNYATKQREKILPGSGAIFNQAGNILQSYLRGEIPQDVINQTNRTVAERTGGGNNPWTGGGQTNPDFARSIGQTSLGIQQAGLSMAPSWQQLAQSFVTMPQEFGPLASSLGELRYHYDALNSGINQFNEEGRLGVLANQYTAGQDQYNAGQLANYQQYAQGQNTASNLIAGVGALGQVASTYQGNTSRLPVRAPTQYKDASGNWQNVAGNRNSEQAFYGLPAMSAYQQGRL